MKKILILASNPRKDLNLDDEIRLLRDVVERSRDRDQFEIVSVPGVRVGDLQGLLLRHKPQIVHFCGHGGGEAGLIFKMEGGGEQWVRADALASMFKLNPICSNVKCVLLNACYSEEQANAIVSGIDYVVGMSHEIQDEAAIAFSKGFYLALGYGCSIEDAFEFGKNAIHLEISGSSKKRSAVSEAQRKLEVIDAVTNTSIPEHLKPILKKKAALTLDESSELPSSNLNLSREKKEEIQLNIDKLLREDAKIVELAINSEALHQKDAKAVFICYSHQDKTWRDKLLKFLQPLNDEEQIVWSDLDLQPGDMWDEKIKDSLSQVTIALILVSQDLLNSSYVKNEELPRLLKRREEEGVRIIPIFVSPSTVKNVSFKYTNQAGIEQKFSLNQFQSPGNNSPSNPLCDLTESEQYKLFVSLEEILRSLIEESKKKRSETSPPLSTPAVINTELPPVHKWQGRREEMQELLTALGKDNLKLIEITAPGGYGKTALAVKFQEQLTPNWRVLWVNFNQPYPLAQLGRWLLEKLNQTYDERWDEETLIQQMIQGLNAESCLLVLNNLETVLTANLNSVYQQFLSQWLAKGRNSKLLLTSRELPKFSPNLRHYHLILPLKGLAEADAIRYVTEDHGLTGNNEELAQFVNKMGRHPLLMELVCSLMVDEFGEGVSVTESQNLGLNVFEVAGYHRDTETCVREVIVASLQRLSQELGESLTRLSVLRGNFDLGLARGLNPEITDKYLRSLARLSLLQEFPPEPKAGKPRRFEFLPLISMVVQDQGDAEVLQSAHQSALDYYLAHLPAPPWESLEDVTAYLEGFYHAGELGEWQLAYDILNEERGGEGKNKSVDRFLDFQGFYRQRADLYEQVIAGSKKEQYCYRASCCHLGLCYDSLGQYEKAIAYHQQYHDISEEMGDRQGVAISLGNLGNCYYSLGQYEKAISYHQQHHDISEEIGYWQGAAISLGNLGNCYRSLGQYEKAIAHYQQCHDISEEMGFRQGVTSSLGNLGNCYNSLGQYEKAISYHLQSLEISEEMGDRQRVAISLGNLGICYQNLGQYEKAINHHQQYHDISKEIGYRRGVAISLYNTGEAFFKLENYREAERKIQESLVISQEIKYKELTAYSLKFLAEIFHKTDRPDRALNYCQNALELSQELGIPLVKECEELLGEIQVTLEEGKK